MSLSFEADLYLRMLLRNHAIENFDLEKRRAAFEPRAGE